MSMKCKTFSGIPKDVELDVNKWLVARHFRIISMALSSYESHIFLVILYQDSDTKTEAKQDATKFIEDYLKRKETTE